MKLILKIWTYIQVAVLLLKGVIKNYIEPVIQLLQIVKHLATNDGELTDELIRDFIREVFGDFSKTVRKMMDAFVVAAWELLPASVFEGVSRKSFYETVTAVIRHFRSLADSKIIYAYLLMLAARMFVIMYGKPMHSTESMFLTQLGYTYMKRRGKLANLNS